MCLSIPHRMCYLIDVVEFQIEIWSKLEKEFGQHTEEISAKHLESAYGISFQVFPSSIISQEDEVMQEEEMTKSSTNSIRNQTHYVAALKIFEKFNVSCFHAATPNENIQTSTVEELSIESLTLIGSNSEIQGLSIMLVSDLMIFCEKNQAPEVSFKIDARMCYLIDVVEFPSEIWSILDKEFCQQIEDISTENRERTYGISFQVLPTSIISQEDEVL